MLCERLQKRAERLKNEDLYAKPVAVEYDPRDEKLPEAMMIAKRLTDYFLHQEVRIDDDATMTGLIRFDRTVPADIFTRRGHRFFADFVLPEYYQKPQEGLCTLEWQHSNADFGRVIERGLSGYIADINRARQTHLHQLEKLEYLGALEMMCRGISEWACRCAEQALARSREAAGPERRRELERLAAICRRVPAEPARTFEEAVHCLHFLFPFLPDSIGRADQYLYPFYRRDIDAGTLSAEKAKELLHELFIAIDAFTPFNSVNFDRGAESHFVVGGYTRDREDGFNDLSRLIVEAMMEIPLHRPQASLRWTEKTPREVLRFMLDCERKDRFKRFAFVNDEPRIRSLMKINRLSFEEASDYIMCGCNEPAFSGSISLGGNTVNITQSLVRTLFECGEELKECADFEAFYAVYERELFRDLAKILEYNNRFNALRSKDVNVLSALFLNGCIENAASATRGGVRHARGGGANLMGFMCVIDSLSIIRQFVFEEKKLTLAEFAAILQADWKGHEKFRTEILRRGRFFGNHDPLSDDAARRFTTSIFRFAENRTDLFGTPITYGNLTGYNPHYAWFGALTPATPDGRMNGTAFGVGSGQYDGKDRNDMTALLLSVAKMDPTGIMCGNTVFNLMVDHDTVNRPESFEKLVLLLETYFREGGLHVQLNHVSREELLAAKTNPDAYKSLRVRVSGFSANFISLNEAIQNDVIRRTEHQS